jgi:hypothetical protein
MARSRDEEDDYDDRPRRRRPDEEDEPRTSRADLRDVAWYQKMIILCILAYLGIVAVSVAMNALPPEIQLLGRLGLFVYILAVVVTAIVFVFLLALKLYSTGIGVLLGFLTLLPCIGLIVLLILNSKATSLLQKHNVRVGLFGANMSDLR